MCHALLSILPDARYDCNAQVSELKKYTTQPSLVVRWNFMLYLWYRPAHVIPSQRKFLQIATFIPRHEIYASRIQVTLIISI